ncbi:hypothetical protein HAX54_051494, partial [Datura stramonium]|nr:hypothetical protein [Datura stramonium]
LEGIYEVVVGARRAVTLCKARSMHRLSGTVRRPWRRPLAPTSYSLESIPSRFIPRAFFSYASCS